MLDLPLKSAERLFLEKYPLPTDTQAWLWLDNPADWETIENHARAWIDARAQSGTGNHEELIAAWWEEEVAPAARRCDADQEPTLHNYLCHLRASRSSRAGSTD